MRIYMVAFSEKGRALAEKNPEDFVICGLRECTL